MKKPTDNNLIDCLRKEAARNAQMQGEAHHTNRRRKTFKYRNHMFANAADRITEQRKTIVSIKLQLEMYEPGVGEAAQVLGNIIWIMDQQ